MQNVNFWAVKVLPLSQNIFGMVFLFHSLSFELVDSGMFSWNVLRHKTILHILKPHKWSPDSFWTVTHSLCSSVHWECFRLSNKFIHMRTGDGLKGYYELETSLMQPFQSAVLCHCLKTMEMGYRNFKTNPTWRCLVQTAL